MLVLASASKARSLLLKQAGINHQSIVSEIDEAEFKNPDPAKLVVELAKAKATAVASKIIQKNLTDASMEPLKRIIGCDSLFEFEGAVFGKPRNANEAHERLGRMSGKSGRLITGHCLLSANKLSTARKRFLSSEVIQSAVITKVYFAHLTKEEIESYVSSGEPMKCAGGFALEGKGGMLIRRIDGCFSNVIGLSLPWLREALSS